MMWRTWPRQSTCSPTILTEAQECLRTPRSKSGGLCCGRQRRVTAHDLARAADNVAGKVGELKLLVIGVKSIAVEAPQFLQRFVLDLANTLTANLQLLANFG